MILSVKSELSKAKPAAQNRALQFGEAANQMKLERGRRQAATQVKGSSAENFTIPVADTVHFRGRQKFSDRQGENGKSLAASKTAAWDQEDELGTWETQGVTLVFGLRGNKP